MIKNKKMVARAIVAIIGVFSMLVSAFVAIPQFMQNDKYVDKIEREPKFVEKLPQREDFEPSQNN